MHQAGGKENAHKVHAAKPGTRASTKRKAALQKGLAGKKNPKTTSQEGKRAISVRNAIALSKSCEISFIDCEPQVTLLFVL